MYSFDSSLPHAIVDMGAYPGVGSRVIRGTLAVQSAGSMLHINGVITGLEPNLVGGWHVHEGFTCGDAGLVGGHYFSGGVDPWIGLSYTADANGVATIATSMPGFSLHGDMAVAGRTIVIHLASNPSVKVGCGVITPTKAELVSLGDYPEYKGGRELRGL